MQDHGGALQVVVAMGAPTARVGVPTAPYLERGSTPALHSGTRECLPAPRGLTLMPQVATSLTAVPALPPTPAARRLSLTARPSATQLACCDNVNGGIVEAEATLGKAMAGRSGAHGRLLRVASLCNVGHEGESLSQGNGV